VRIGQAGMAASRPIGIRHPGVTAVRCRRSLLALSRRRLLAR